jgi:hypothetical protein
MEPVILLTRTALRVIFWCQKLAARSILDPSVMCLVLAGFNRLLN